MTLKVAEEGLRALIKIMQPSSEVRGEEGSHSDDKSATTDGCNYIYDGKYAIELRR